MLQKICKNSGFKIGSVIFILTVELISIMFAGSVVKNGFKFEDVFIFMLFFFVGNVLSFVFLTLSNISISDFVKITKAFGNFVKVAEK